MSVVGSRPVICKLCYCFIYVLVGLYEVNGSIRFVVDRAMVKHVEMWQGGVERRTKRRVGLSR